MSVKKIATSKNDLSKKIDSKTKKAIAVIMSAIICGSMIPFVACSNESQNSSTDVTEISLDEQKLIDNEKNEELKAIYTEIAECSEGEELIQELQLIDKVQREINELAIANKDENGKVSYVRASEVAAAHDVYNANNPEIKTLTESKELILCNFFGFHQNVINLSQGSMKSVDYTGLVTDETVKEDLTKAKEHTQKALDNDTKGIKKFANNIYNNRDLHEEAQSDIAWGQLGVAAALENVLEGKALKNYQHVSKTDNDQLGKLISQASADSKQYSPEEKVLIAKAFIVMDKKNYAEDYSRTGYDVTTTAKGKERFKAIIGDIAVDDQGNYWVIDKKTKTTTTRKKLTKEEAVKKVGKEKVKEAEKKADKTDKVVDTNGDGKADSSIDEANKKEQEKAEETAKSYSESYAAGEAAYQKGTGYNPSGYNQSGYNAGWNNAKSVYENQPETKETKSEVKQVKKVESYSKDNSEVIEIELDNGEVLTSSIQKTRM